MTSYPCSGVVAVGPTASSKSSTSSKHFVLLSLLATFLWVLLLGGGDDAGVVAASDATEPRKAAPMVIKMSYEGGMASFVEHSEAQFAKGDESNRSQDWWETMVQSALRLNEGEGADHAETSVHCQTEAVVFCFVTGSKYHGSGKEQEQGKIIGEAGNRGNFQATVFMDEALDQVTVEARLVSSSKSESFAEFQEQMVQLALALDVEEQGIWTISSPTAPPSVVEEETSLYNVVLTNPSLTHKKRVLHTGHVSVWTYRVTAAASSEEEQPVEAVFLHDTLRFTTLADASVAQAEAMVHPAMMAHSEPARVLLISDMPLAPLRELLKYSATTLDHVDVVGTSDVVLREVLFGRYGLQEELLRADHGDDEDDDELVSLIDAPSGVFDWVQKEVARRGIVHLEAAGKTASFHDDMFDPCHNDTDKYPAESPQKREERMAWLSALCENDAFARQNKQLGLDWEREIYCKERYYALDDVDALEGKELQELWWSAVLDKDDNDSHDDDDDGAFDHGDEEYEEDSVRANPDLAELLSYDVILVDIPYYDQDSLTFSWLHRHLMALNAKNEDFMLVVNAGSAPELKESRSNNELSSKKNMARDVFLRQLTRPTSKGGLAYQYATVYDEPLAAPLSSAFAIAFQWEDGDAYTRFYRTNSAAFDMDLLDRLVPYTGAGKPPTVLYDGPTHVNQYQLPSRRWEEWYCRSAPGRDLPGCTLFQNWMFDPARHHKNVERRVHPVKGRSLFVVDDVIPKDHFVNFDDVIHSLHLDATEWDSLVNFVERYPDASLYRALRDFIVIYGFEAKAHGMTGWAVSSSSTNTFTNHACTDEDRTVTTGDAFVSLGEDGLYTRFSPVASRRPRIASYVTTAQRDLVPGDEVQINYQSFRTDFAEHPYFDMFLSGMCSSGVGMVPVPQEDTPDRIRLVGDEGGDINPGVVVDVQVDEEDFMIQPSGISLGEITRGGVPLTPTLDAVVT